MCAATGSAPLFPIAVRFGTQWRIENLLSKPDCLVVRRIDTGKVSMDGTSTFLRSVRTMTTKDIAVPLNFLSGT